MSDRYAYIGVRPCGCVTAATVDDPADAEGVAEDLASWVRSGRHVERTTVEDARARLSASRWPCDAIHGAA